MNKYITTSILSICILLSTSTSVFASTTITTATGNYVIENKEDVYSPNEYPLIKISGKSNLKQTFQKFISSILNKPKDLIEIKNPEGQIIFSQNIKSKEDKIEVDKGLIPGKYEILLNNETVDTFAWGVLVINHNQDQYLPNQTAYLQFAALDSTGNTICDADLSFQVTEPSGTISNYHPNRSSTCGVNNVTDNPDYYYHLPLGNSGQYKIILTNNNNGYSTDTTVQVVDHAPYIVERVGATRLNPFKSDYTMNLKVKAYTNFEGTISETLGESFYAKTPTTWEVKFVAGETYDLSYTYQAPKISPAIFTLGPIKIGDHQELRKWQLALDSGTIDHVFVEQTTQQTRTGSTAYGDISGATISSSNFTAGKKYLLVVNAWVSKSTTGTRAAIKTVHGSTDFSTSVMVLEPQTTTSWHPYTWFTVWTAVSGEDIKLQFATPNSSAQTVRADQITMLAINLSDDLTENTDWYFSEDTSGPTTYTTTMTDRASVTFTPGTASDSWLVMGTNRSQGVGGADNQESQLLQTGATASNEPLTSQEGEDTTNDRFVHTLFKVYSLPASSQTFTMRSRQDSVTVAGSYLSSAVFALNLSKFKNQASVYTAAQSSGLSTTNFASNVQTLEFTPDNTGPVWVMSSWTGDAVAAGNYQRSRLQVEDDSSTLNDQPPSQTSDEYQQNDAWDGTDELLYQYQTVTTLGGSIAHTINSDGSNEVSGGVSEDRTIFAVTMELATPPNTPPSTPSLDAPSDTATNQSLTPTLQTTTTDPNSDYLKYKIELCENVGMTTNCQTFDQTSSQTGWSGQDNPFEDWPYRLKLTIDADEVDADLVDFPVYVDLNDLPADFHSNVNQTDARDIRVTKGDGITELPREVVSYNSSSDTGELHFKYSGTLSGSSDTDIYIYYGNSSASDYLATDTYGRNNVWSSYHTVLHLQETSGVGAYLIDSTGNGRNATPTNTTSTTGKIGNGRSFDGDGDYLTISSPSLPTGQYTYESWAYRNNASNDHTIFMSSDGGSANELLFQGMSSIASNPYALRYTANGISTYSTTDLATSSWQSLGMTRSLTTITGYIDGVADATTGNEVTTLNFSTCDLFIGKDVDSGCDDAGGDWFDGNLDELRISSSALSSTWISTGHNNQNSPSTFFNSIGSQETNSPSYYGSGSQASYTIQSALNTNTTYYWRSSAIDPVGSNTWSSTQGTPFSFTTTTAPSAPTTPYTEGATNPTGITDLTPEFSAIHSDSDSDPAVYYEIEVNNASDFTGTVMWDTGQTAMSSLSSGVRSTDVSYAGTSLSYDGTTYYWRIRFTDDKGAVGSWSAVQSFTMDTTPTDTFNFKGLNLNGINIE